MKNSKDLLKLIGAFLVYFLYSSYGVTLLSSIGIKNSTLAMFVGDIIFLIVILALYCQNLKKDWQGLRKDYKIGKIIKTIVFWVVALFILNIAMGFLTELLFPNLADGSDTNTQALWSLDNLYMIFKSLIFGVVAEELLFRESISTVIKNKPMFIIISAAIYTLMHFIFLSTGSPFVWIDVLIYFIPAILFSIAYVKNNNNILFVMFIKLIYNAIIILLFM